MGTRDMENKETRFYVAGVGAAALMANGISLLSRKTAQDCKDEDKKEKSKCPVPGVSGHGFGQVCGTIAVGASIAMIDRIPLAGIFGMVASLLPYSHAETRKQCPFTTLIALGSCIYMFATKKGRFLE